MIFPEIRISQLSHDLERKKAAFSQSQSALKSEIRRKLSPLTIIKENPQWLLGAAMSVASAGGAGKILGLFGHHNGNGSKTGLLGRLLKFGGRTAVKTVMPVAISALRHTLKSIFRSFQDRHTD